MVFSYQYQAQQETSVDPHFDNVDRRTDVQRSLVAFMAYHSGSLEEYGLGPDTIDSQASASATYYDSAQIPERRAVASYCFNTQFQMVGQEVIRIDGQLCRVANHIPPVNSEVVSSFPAPLNIIINEGRPNAASIMYADYADFRRWYCRLDTNLRNNPEPVVDAIKDLWRTFGPHINHDMRLRLQGEDFKPPEIYISGDVETLSINEVVCSQHYDGQLVTITGQVMEMGDSRKRPVRLAWKCAIPTCGLFTPRMCDPFDENVKPPESCAFCQAGAPDSNTKANFIQAGAPDTTFVTYQRLMARQTDTQMTTPPQMLMELRGSHVHSVNQGEDVAMTGIFRTALDPRGTKTEHIPLLFVTDVETTSRDTTVLVPEAEAVTLRAWKEDHTFEDFLNIMTRATAPSVIGHTKAKQSILLQGVGSYAGLPDNKRKYIHILLIGDPGTAKTELKKFALTMHPGSKEATGARTSIVGLIGGKSENQRLLGSSTTQLAPGMLALIPDGAIAAVDELHALGDPSIFSMLNDAMESGVVSVQMQMKGTILTPTPILGICNPMRGDNTRFDLTSGEPLLDQSGLPASFASRFDIIIIFLDRVNEARDSAIIDGMLNAINNTLNDPHAIFPVPDGYNKYLQLCREVEADEQPITSEAYTSIKALSMEARSTRDVNYRWVAALTRLSCATARLDLSSHVLPRHVDFANSVLQESLTTTDPDMVIEGGSGLSPSQQERHDAVWGIMEEWTQTLGGAVSGLRTAFIEYVQENWSLNQVEHPIPEAVEINHMFDRWRQGTNRKVIVDATHVTNLLA